MTSHRSVQIDFFDSLVETKIDELDQSILMPVVEIQAGVELARFILGDEEIQILRRRMLSHANFHVRRGALKALRLYGAKQIEQVVPLFFEILNDESEHAWNRYEAAWGLSDCGDPRTETREALFQSTQSIVSRFPKLADLTAESSVVSSDAEANLIKRLRKSHRSLELHAKYGADEFKEFSLADSAVGLLAPTTFKFEEMQNLPIYLRHPEIALISYRGTIRAYPDDMNLKDLADFNHELLSQFGELGEIREFDLHGRKAIRFEGPQKANGADTWQMKIYADLGGKSFQLTALCPRLSRDLWKPVFEKSVMALRLGGASARGK